MTMFMVVTHVLQIVLVVIILIALRRVSHKLAHDRALAIEDLVHRADGLAKIADALRESERSKLEGLRQVSDDLKAVAETTASTVIGKIEEAVQVSHAAHEAANHVKEALEKQDEVAAERAEEAARTDPLPDIQRTGEDTNVRVQKLEQKIIEQEPQ